MNIAIAINQNKPGGYSFGDLARILGIRRESVYHGAIKGRRLTAAMRSRLGVTDLREHPETRLQRAALSEHRVTEGRHRASSA
ncbi:hypothetical protein [Nonomuraea rubra]|uniref:hypothetical protein n=1 Tax=Nonomuraea rubra TaxID=46180 RepID=UPI0033D75ABA